MMSKTTASCPCLSVVIPAYNEEATLAEVAPPEEQRGDDQPDDEEAPDDAAID